MEIPKSFLFAFIVCIASWNELCPLCSAAPITKTQNGKSTNDNNKLTDKEFEYIQRFGHIHHQHTRNSISDEELKKGIKSFQRIAGVNQTGQMDNATREMMKRPRCGETDVPNSGRQKRYAFTGGLWPNRPVNLFYRFESFPSTMNPQDVLDCFARAFKLWCQVIPCSFTQTYSTRLANISIWFTTYNHGDGYPFDGPGGILSHTFSPQDGRMHFDDSESWNNASPYGGIDLNQVALHETGHVLGLAHTTVPNNIMLAYYQGLINPLYLGQDDIAGIQSAYGPASGYSNNANPAQSSPATTTTTTTDDQSSITSTTTTSTTTSTTISSTPTSNAMAIQMSKYTPSVGWRNTPMRKTAVRK